MHGLRICPDLDTCMYTLGGVVDTERGWGHAGETWSAKAELAAYDAEPSWFGLGDKDIATHLIRTQMLRAGFPLSAVTEALGARWPLGVALLPASDDRSETFVTVTDPDTGERKAIHFQEWWVRYRTHIPTHGFANIGAEQASPGPGVLEAIESADAVLLAPSNPVVSIGAILAIPGIRGALKTTKAPVVGVSPIIGGKPVRGMADACLDVLGLQTSAQAVAEYYGARSGTGLLDGWLAAPGDEVSVPGIAVRNAPLLMSDVGASAQMAKAALELAGVA
jgi:LPPG:FO 2-phospho-L-lactate transferase